MFAEPPVNSDHYARHLGNWHDAAHRLNGKTVPPNKIGLLPRIQRIGVDDGVGVVSDSMWLTR